MPGGRLRHARDSQGHARFPWSCTDNSSTVDRTSWSLRGGHGQEGTRARLAGGPARPVRAHSAVAAARPGPGRATRPRRVHRRLPRRDRTGRAVRGQPAHRARGPPAATGGRRDQHRPRAAPRIAAPEPVIAQPTGIVYSLFSAVESRGLSQVSVVRALDVRADGVIAPRLGLEESTPLVYLERLRLLDGEPLALDRVWLPASIGEPLLGVDFRRTGVYDELSRTGIRSPADRRPSARSSRAGPSTGSSTCRCRRRRSRSSGRRAATACRSNGG